MARTVTEIEADIAAARAARTKLANGERVKDVWKDGRRVTFSEMSMDDFDTMLDSLKDELADATAAAGTTTRRRRAIAVRYPN